MDIFAFFSIFSSDIRVAIDWKLLMLCRPKVFIKKYKLPVDSDLLWTPWYVNSHGEPRLFFHKDAHPVSVKSASRNEKIISHYNVQKFSLGYLERIKFPAYKLRHDMILLLDGNHRTVAAVKEKCLMKVSALVIDGPLDGNIIPDLSHWI